MEVYIPRMSGINLITLLSSALLICDEVQIVFDWFETPFGVLQEDIAEWDDSHPMEDHRGYEDYDVHGLLAFLSGYGAEWVKAIIHLLLCRNFTDVIVAHTTPRFADSYYMQPDQQHKVKFCFFVYCVGETNDEIRFTITCLHDPDDMGENAWVFIQILSVVKSDAGQEASDDREFLAQFGMTQWSDFDLSPYEIYCLEIEYANSFTESLNEMVLGSVDNLEYADLRSSAKRKKCPRKNPKVEKSLSKASKTRGKKGKRSVDLTPY